MLLLIAGVCGVAIAVWVGLSLSGEREPQYNGRSLSQWVRRSRDDWGFPNFTRILETNEAVEAVRQIGTNALPFLIRWIQCEESELGRGAVVDGLVRKLPVRLEHFVSNILPQNKAAQRWYCGLEGFRILGERAAPAIPELMGILLGTNSGSDFRSMSAGIALRFIGEAAVPALAQSIRDPACPGREQAASVVVEMSGEGVRVRPVVEALVDSVGDTNTEFAVLAVESLGRMRVEPDIAVPALVRAARGIPMDEYWGFLLRRSAIRALGEFGQQAKEAVPVLREMSMDERAEVRIEATRALFRIAPEQVRGETAD
jgi:hypothetical protein